MIYTFPIPYMTHNADFHKLVDKHSVTPQTLNQLKVIGASRQTFMNCIDRFRKGVNKGEKITA